LSSLLQNKGVRIMKMEPVSDEELKSILSPDLFILWTAIIAKIDAVYD